MKTKMIDSPRSGEATLITEQQGLYGRVRHWRIDDGSFVVTSSAHHYPDDILVSLRESIDDMPHPDGLVSETVAFPSNEAGEITDWAGICKVYRSEAHEAAMHFAGFTLWSDRVDTKNEVV